MASDWARDLILTSLVPQVPHRVDRVHPAAADPVDGHYHQSISGGQFGVESRQPARLLVPVPPEMPTSRWMLASGTPSCWSW